MGSINFTLLTLTLIGQYLSRSRIMKYVCGEFFVIESNNEERN